MKDQIIFDTTDADTIADSDKILAGLISTDGTTLLTDTAGTGANAGKQGQDVYVINNDFDVNLQAGDGTDITQTGGALDVNIASGSITVVESDVYAEDSAHSSGDEGSHTLGVRNDTPSSLTDADGDYASLTLDASNRLWVSDDQAQALLTTIDTVLDSIKVDTGNIATDVAAIETELLDQGTTLDSIDTNITNLDSTLTALSKAEDSVHSSGDQGIMALAVRNDAGTPLAADGDYIPFSMTSTGALRVEDTGSGSDNALANTAIANAVKTLTTGGTAEDLVASPLSDRKYLFTYNNDNRRMYIGASGVTAANGFPIAPRAYMELRAGAAIDIEFVSAKTGHNARTLELS